MTISPTSPTEPEPSWQPPLRRQVTFTERIDIYNGRVLAASLPDNDDSNGNGLFSKHKPSVEGQLEAGETRASRSRRTICCLSRRTFFALIVVAVFLLGGLLGGVAAVRISKKPDTPYVNGNIAAAAVCQLLENRR